MNTNPNTSRNESDEMYTFSQLDIIDRIEDALDHGMAWTEEHDECLLEDAEREIAILRKDLRMAQKLIAELRAAQ
jgi:hypothetical protein